MLEHLHVQVIVIIRSGTAMRQVHGYVELYRTANPPDFRTASDVGEPCEVPFPMYQDTRTLRGNRTRFDIQHRFSRRNTANKN